MTSIPWLLLLSSVREGAQREAASPSLDASACYLRVSCLSSPSQQGMEQHILTFAIFLVHVRSSCSVFIWTGLDSTQLSQVFFHKGLLERFPCSI